MYFKKTIVSCLLTALVLIPLNASASNIDAAKAKATARNFLTHSSSPSLRSAAIADLNLIHVEPSISKIQANAYYAFNITGGGFIIVAGEDRANQILGYSDQGHLDFNRLPDNVQALLNSYAEEISYLQSHPDMVVSPTRQISNGNGVEPLIKSHWGQEMPYNQQCPVYQGEYCVVGCVATAMTQVMHYWQYPTTSPEISAYYCYDIGQTLAALPETNFEYNKMLNSYCHWDYDLHELIQDTYTEEQAQAVAKLARYCGQAVHMGYSPEGSGAYVSDQLTAMKNFGYTSTDDVSRDSWWGSGYSDQEWESMIRTELDAGRPILYSATDYSAGGHAFVCDGYNNEGLFHFNFGWYGTCDGWYATTALNMTHREGDQLHFNWGHEMLTHLVPPTYCVISSDYLTASDGLLILGESIDTKATNVNIRTTHSYINLVFSLCDETGRRIANSSAVKVTLSNFNQGSDVAGTLSLPGTLEEGTYDLKLYYYVSMPRAAELINCEAGKLIVVGHVAKYNSTFTIDDVTTLINYLLNGTYPGQINIDDVTDLINYLLTNH